MEDNKNVPYIVHESVLARMERTIKRLVVALILTILLMFATNALWLHAWVQFDYESEEQIVTTYTQDGRGLNIIGTGNEVTNGADSYYSNNPEETPEAEEAK